MSSSSRFRGILSTKSNNRTDDKDRSVTQMILSLIGFRASTLKSPTILIDTLHYTTLTKEQVVFIPFIGAGPYCGITTQRMTDAAYAIDPSTSLTFVGFRIPIVQPDVSKFTVAQYNETITLQNSFGSIGAVATYDDAGGDFETTTAEQTYKVLNGVGKYAYAKLLKIVFNNTPGVMRREVFVYAYQ
jgi:hypothetical protein